MASKFTKPLQNTPVEQPADDDDDDAAASAVDDCALRFFDA